MPGVFGIVTESPEGHPEVVRSLEEIQQKGKDAEAQLLAVSGSFAAITAASLGLTDVSTRIEDIGRAAAGWFPQILNFFGVVGGAAAAFTASAAGLKELTDTLLFSQANLKGTAETTGIAAEQLQKLAAAAKSVGIEQETFFNGLTVFSTRLSQARSGSDDLAAQFDRLGVKLRDSKGAARENLQVFLDFSDAVKALPAEQQLGAIATGFGERLAANAAALRLGREGFLAYGRAIEKVGGVVKGDLVDAGAEAQKALVPGLAALEAAQRSGFLEEFAGDAEEVAAGLARVAGAFELLGGGKATIAALPRFFALSRELPDASLKAIQTEGARLQQLVEDRGGVRDLLERALDPGKQRTFGTKDAVMLETVLKNANKAGTAGTKDPVMLETLLKNANKAGTALKDLGDKAEESQGKIERLKNEFEGGFLLPDDLKEIFGTEGADALTGFSGLDQLENLPPLLDAVGEAQARLNESVRAGPAVAGLLPTPALLADAGVGLSAFAGTAAERFSETAQRLQDGLGQTILDIFDGASPKAALKNFTRFAKASFSGLLQDLAGAALRNPIVTQSGRTPSGPPQGRLQPA